MGTKMRSKEDKILELFLNSPTKEWHFEEILSKTKMARSKASAWLREFQKKKYIKKIKKKAKTPYYLGNYEEPEYQNKKRLHAQILLYQSGLLNYLCSLEKTRTIIIFGSITRWDYYPDSDIDIFIYGDPKEIDLKIFQNKLSREIQLFICKNTADLRKFQPGMLTNILKGHLVKGDLDFIKVEIDDKIS
jgi:predicted nucleotidyltransferase